MNKKKPDSAKIPKGTSESTNKERSLNTDKIDDFHIVAIGSSAGGLEALEGFFKNMPKDNGMAFVVIQHLDPNHKGIMPELLQRITPMNVLQVTDRLKVLPNHVYIIPPNKSMSILGRVLHLFDPVEKHGIRLPIDTFFNSMADDLKEKSIGIVLSGMGSDGSMGLKAIKENNGFVLIQEPDSAKFNGMPVSAMEAVMPDIVATADQLPLKLIKYLKHFPVTLVKNEDEKKHFSSIEKVVILLRQKTGHDFSLYKKNTLFRRIERRKGVHEIENIKNYVRFLQENPEEIEILFKELLIGVTSFFRDQEVWSKLQIKVIPELIADLPNGSVLRAWVPACSTGEEVFSLAIVCKEAIKNLKSSKNLTFQIFATDIDPNAIDFARKALYSKNIISQVSPDIINSYFIEEDSGYRLNSTIREMVVFAQQNVIKDPPFTKLDILSCRNMLIYMEPILQKKIIGLFHYSLNPGGVMILGSAETLGNKNDGFKDIDQKLKIYKHLSEKASVDLLDFPSSFHRSKTSDTNKVLVPKVENNIQSVADRFILNKFSPSSILVNERGDIIYISGRTGAYLEPASGKANWNIFAMAREGLSKVLPSAFRKVKATFDPVSVKDIRIGLNGGSLYVDIIVQRIENPKLISGLIVIVINEVEKKKNIEKKSSTTETKSTGRLKQLELELQRSYEDLQSTNEEMQTSQEELKSTNEELQSTNEELQSTNEELTTSKEEMQSLNEELQTVNMELQSKVNDFARASDDMKNLLNSTEIATLFLDKELNVRRFTDKITDIMRLRIVDIGRPFTDIVSKMNYPEIGDHAHKVLSTLSTIETSISTENNKWYDVRIMPYRTLDDHIDGLVITFTDTTIAKKLEIQLKETNLRLEK